MKLYHCTSDLESVLKQGAIHSIMRRLPFSDHKKVHDETLIEYQQITSQMASLARTRGLQTKNNQTEEELADLAEAHGLGKTDEYKGLKRRCFVYLGTYQRALLYGGVVNNVLEFEIPEEKIRKGHPDIDSLVWWELSLNHLTKIFTQTERIDETKQLLEKYGLINREVIDLNTLPIL